MSQEIKKHATRHYGEWPIKVNTVSRHLGGIVAICASKLKTLMVRDICESDYI
jgi:hypothetical protein